jgi:hypothetical protein
LAGTEGKSAATIVEKTAGAQKLLGYSNLYWGAKAGRLWLEIDKRGAEFLYQTSLPAGVGSSDIGLDRGQLGDTRVVRFERSGPKVLLMQSNLGYRAISKDADERQAVRESFAESALWGFKVEAEEGERALVDATELDLRYNVIQWVHRATRGWSYGKGVIDPRTGEIIKGRVTLGSLRVRRA